MAMKVNPSAGHAENTDKDCGTIRVFVYGSLKRGQPNSIVLNKCNAERVGFDSITGKYMMVSLGCFPGVCTTSQKDADEQIFGEVWSGDEEMLHALDILEGHPSFYERRKVWTTGQGKRVWVYILPQDWAEEADDVVEHGIWKPSDRELNHWGRDKLGLVGVPQDVKNRG